MFKRLREDTAVVFDRDPAARNTWEVITAYPGLHALWAHRINHVLWGWHLYWLARMGSHFARWLTGIEIHPGAHIGRRFFIDHGMGVVIGETAEIGDDCTLYHGVTLGGTSWQKGKRHPTLEKDVVIGAGAKVLGPITLGTGARVGSNAVVTKDVDQGATVVGVPGHAVQPRRSKEQQAEYREQMARKMGFDAYGIVEDMPDPVSKAITRMLDHMHESDQRLDEICRMLKESDSRFEKLQSPELKVPEFEKNSGQERDAGESPG
jgi:serine O-acetyltransferase